MFTITIKSKDGKRAKEVQYKTVLGPLFLEFRVYVENIYLTYSIERGDDYNKGLAEVKEIARKYIFKED